MSRWAAQTSRVRVSARSRPSPPLYPHFNRPSGFWPCVRSCLVGGSDKYMAYCLLNTSFKGDARPTGFTCFAGLGLLLGVWSAPMGEYRRGQVFLGQPRTNRDSCVVPTIKCPAAFWLSWKSDTYRRLHSHTCRRKSAVGTINLIIYILTSFGSHPGNRTNTSSLVTNQYLVSLLKPSPNNTIQS